MSEGTYDGKESILIIAVKREVWEYDKGVIMHKSNLCVQRSQSGFDFKN